MLTSHIADLLAPFLDRAPSPAQLDQVSTYLDLLLRWNSRINLTAIRNPDEIITRHFGESFFLARHLFPSGRPPSPVSSQNRDLPTTNHYPLTTVLDIGSGAGFPALPLKIFAPEIHLTLIESNYKKSAFLREVIRSLLLADVNVIADRAENARGENLAVSKNDDETAARHQAAPAKESKREIEGSKFDIVTFRAVEKFQSILPLAHSFLKHNGTLALLIGATQLSSIESLADVSWIPPIYVPKSQQRVVALGCRKRF